MKIRGCQNYSSKGIQTRIASGSVEGLTTVYIHLDRDYYEISTKPLNVKVAVQTTWQGSRSGGCNPRSESHSGSGISESGTSNLVGKARYGPRKDVLSGSTTKKDGTTVSTITWNLRFCE